MEDVVRKYSVLPDSHDKSQDYKLESLVDKSIQLPKRVDLSPYIPEVLDQGSLGSCTANAGVRFRTYFDKVMMGDYTELSRLFLYYQERLLEGTPGEDSGASMYDIVRVLNKIGVCPETDQPYFESDFTNPPTDKSIAEAASFKIASYHRVSTYRGVLTALASGYPVLLGIKVYESFESSNAALTGVIPVPDVTKERLLGGHAILATGYQDMDDGKQYVDFLNSWGQYWGRNGYGLLTEEFFTSGMVTDMWTGTIEGFVPPTQPGPAPVPDPTPTPSPDPVDPSTVDINEALNYFKDQGIIDSPELWTIAIRYIKDNHAPFASPPLSVLNFLDLLIKKLYLGCKK